MRRRANRFLLLSLILFSSGLERFANGPMEVTANSLWSAVTRASYPASPHSTIDLPSIDSQSGLTRLTEASTQAGFCEKLKPCQLLMQAEAEKILGQAVRLSQNISELKGDVRQCRCAYTSLANDPSGGQEMSLYFSIEQREINPSTEQAQQVMESTKNDNAHDQEIIDLPDIGDEAFRLGDLSNRHLIMARKGAVIMRLQITRATNKSALDELKAFAKKVAKLL